MRSIAHHPNIATFLGASFERPDELNEAIITIFYERLEPAEKYIYHKEGSKASPFQRLKFIHQISLGFSYLEGMKIYHGDIKVENLLCKFIIKITKISVKQNL
eukprot:TRINITY_DN6778_c0_g1_i1.p2 TRINITY_DN6778_c0_g1~~TRINITY_DN6778_c0_g1_i1.p2  ORF type:complete len:103 (+),score=18.49 TRINITY_DN6778_c0_g1_i1:480-788(+)